MAPVRYYLACDWDGVINKYVSGFSADFDDPVPGAIDFLKTCLLAGKRLVIHSTRFTEPDGDTSWRMRQYLVKHGLPQELADQLDFWFAGGKPRALVYLDDRGYRFEGVFPSLEELDALDVWNRSERVRKRGQ
jgi:hypothetical protein